MFTFIDGKIVEVKPIDRPQISLNTQQSLLQIKKVETFGLTTKVTWSDNTQTQVALSPRDSHYDLEKAILYAYAIRNSPESRTKLKKRLEKIIVELVETLEVL